MKNIKLIALLLLMLVSGCEAAYCEETWNRVIVHISDSTHMTQDECNDWHRQRGWDGCGYNFVVEPDGVIYAARGYEKVGAHVAGHNTGSLGFCFVTTNLATPEQLEAYRSWLAQTRAEFGNLPVFPHRFYNHGKTCPAGVWEQIGGGK